MSRPELLSPAGNMDCFKSAVAAGCNAVYFGGTRFNARHGAAGFDIPTMEEAVQYAHLHDVKTLLTVNTLIKETEWQDFAVSMDQMAQTGIDGVIVQDLGVAAYIRKNYPWIALHGSTQMSVHSPEGVRFLEDLGFQRVVLARELSLDDVQKIREATQVELEVFIHGALCYSVSGQCLLSSFIGGRSGNRGMCAQPCRLPYSLEDSKPAYLMDLKDMCTLDILPQIISAGVDSLKIEGRLKSPEYVYGVTSGYRKALDHLLPQGEIESHKTEMAQLFNRGGFSHGYWVPFQDSMIEPNSPKHQGLKIGKITEIRGGRVYIESKETLHVQDVLEIRTGRAPFPSYQLQERNLQANGKGAWVKVDVPVQTGMDVYRLIDHALMERFSSYEQPKRSVCLSIEMIPDQESRLTASCGDVSITITGAKVEKALERGLDETSIRRSLQKTGGTAFTVENISIHSSGEVFLPVSALNDLRRNALSSLEEALCKRNQMFFPPLAYGSVVDQKNLGTKLEAVVSSETQWQAVKAQKIDHVWFRKECFSKNRIETLLEEASAAGINRGISLPYFDLRSTWEQIEYDNIPVLVHSLGQLGSYQSAFVSSDMQIPVMNRTAAALLRSFAGSVTLSVESSADELSLVGSPSDAIIAYGKIPVMTTRQCLQREGRSCHKGSGDRFLTIHDRKGVSWTAELHCGRDCYNILYTGQPVWMADRSKALRKTGAGNWRLLFLDEDAEQTTQVLQAYQNAVRGMDPGAAPKNMIRGHFFKPCL